MSHSKNEVELNWEDNWKEILELPDGSINVEQLKLELMDFSDMIHRTTQLTAYITGERLSYPTYDVATIKSVHQECLEEEREDQMKDDLEDGVCSWCEQEFEQEPFEQE